MHSGRLESTQEARVALGYHLVHLLRTLRVYTHAFLIMQPSASTIFVTQHLGFHSKSANITVEEN